MPICVKFVSLKNLFANFCQEHFFVAISTPGHAVALLVETLRYTPKDRGFDFRGCHWDFSVKTRDFSWEMKAVGA
jgi:hypothetical protein